MTPTIEEKNSKFIKGIESDAPIPREDMTNVTQIDGGILEYVRERMGCKRITPEVRRQTALFQAEMERMSGW